MSFLTHTHPRLSAGMTLGIAAGILVPAESIITKILIGWNAGVWTYLILMAWIVVRSKAADVKRIADMEDENAGLVLFVVCIAALASLAVAEASRYPSLSFTGSIATGGSQARDWLSQPVLSLSSSLLVPLIDWRRLNYEREGARTGLEQAALSLRDTVHKALVDAEGQWTQREKLQRQTDAQARRVAEARENERLAALRLEVGAIGRNDWLQARVALLEAQQSLLQLQLQGWLNQAALYRALGGVSAG